MFIKSLSGKPFTTFKATNERYHAPTEIEGALTIIQHYFGRIGVLQSFQTILWRKRLDQRRYLCLFILETLLDNMQLFCLDERFVTLDIHDDIKVTAEVLVCFLNAVGSTLVMNTGHDDFSAEALHGIKDSRVIRSNESLVQNTLYLPVNSFDNSPSSQHR